VRVARILGSVKDTMIAMMVTVVVDTRTIAK
jgi:hypothetical protein